MSFLYPAFLLGAMAIAIPIVLHLLRRDEAPEVPFTAVRLLRKSPPEQTRRRRLRDWLLLMARVAALLLLAFVFARPFVTGSTDAPLHVVAIDRSYTMDAEGRFAEALALARAAIDATPPGSRVALLAFDHGADVLAGPGAAGDARGALDGLQPGYGRGQYGGLVARVLELGGGAAVRLDIISDLQRGGWAGAAPVPIPADMTVRLHGVTPLVSNAAVTDLRRVDDGVAAVIEHAGATAMSGTARLVVDGQRVGEMPFVAPAAGSVEIRFAHPLGERGGVAVEIDDPTGVRADNRRHLVLDPPDRLSVLVLAEDAGHSGVYLASALEAVDGVDVQTVRPAGIGRMPADTWSGTGAVVLLSTRGLDRRARDALVTFAERGGGLLIAATADVDAGVLASAMGWHGLEVEALDVSRAALGVTDLRHPVFSPFGALVANVGDVRFDRIWDVRTRGWDVAARFSNGAPALLERRHGRGRVLLFASDLDRRWNDFPLHPSFVPFAIESVRHVAGRPATPRDYVVGETPSGVGPLPGVYTAPDDGRRVAVNVDLRERSLERMSDDEFMAMVPPVPPQLSFAGRAPVEQVEARQGLWRYAVLLMLGVLVAESFIGRPR